MMGRPVEQILLWLSRLPSLEYKRIQSLLIRLSLFENNPRKIIRQYTPVVNCIYSLSNVLIDGEKVPTFDSQEDRLEFATFFLWFFPRACRDMRTVLTLPQSLVVHIHEDYKEIVNEGFKNAVKSYTEKIGAGKTDAVFKALMHIFVYPSADTKLSTPSKLPRSPSSVRVSPMYRPG